MVPPMLVRSVLPCPGAMQLIVAVSSVPGTPFGDQYFGLVQSPPHGAGGPQGVGPTHVKSVAHAGVGATSINTPTAVPNKLARMISKAPFRGPKSRPIEANIPRL